LEALDLIRRCDGKESAEVASYHHRMAFVCQEQAQAITIQVDMRTEYILTNSMCCYHSQGSRVLVERLQNKLQYNGLEGVVVNVDALRLRMCLDSHDNEELILKPQNVRQLFPTALKLEDS